MWVSRISRLGAQAIKKVTQGKLTHIPWTQYLYASSSRIHTVLQLPLQTHRYFGTTVTAASCKDGNGEQTTNVTFVETDWTEKQVKVLVGINMLEAAHANDFELEGACEGSCACSTCHIIVMDVDYYHKLPDPSDEENDMLDLAFGLTETRVYLLYVLQFVSSLRVLGLSDCLFRSRLGCQIEAKPEIDGIRLALPVATRNFAVDGYKPKPH